MIPHSKPDVGLREGFAALRAVLRGELGRGRDEHALAHAVSERAGLEHAFGTASGSNALFLLLRGMGIGPGDSVISPSYVCTSVPRAIEMTGAQVLFADIGEGVNLDPSSVDALSRNDTRAVVLPHLFGHAADAEAFPDHVIEDLAQHPAHGPSSADHRIYSFYATKPVAGGRGGMLATRDAAVADRIEDLMRYDARDTYGESYSMSISNLDAAVARVQFSRLDALDAKRSALADRYDAALADRGLEERIVRAPEGSHPYRYLVEFSDARDAVDAFRAKGIGAARPIYAPAHLLSGAPHAPSLPNTERAFERYVSIPLFSTLASSDQDRVIDALASIADRYA